MIETGAVHKESVVENGVGNELNTGMKGGEQNASAALKVIKDGLVAIGQEHLETLFANLPSEEALKLYLKLRDVDWAALRNPAPEKDFSKLEQARVISLEERGVLKAEAERLGTQAYAAGEVAVLMVAGGQGSRLGFPGPKGCYPLWGKRTLYQIFAEKVFAASEESGKTIPFEIMTSPHTNDETVAFFQANKNFGLAEGQVRYIQQAMVPTLDTEGRVLLASPTEILENPDGHGGCIRALGRSGQLSQLKAEGIKHILYLQVDNPLAPIYDPFFVGARILKGADMMTKVVQKTSVQERVGNLASSNGRDCMVEYIELNSDQQNRLDATGKPFFNFGNLAIQVFGVPFLERAVTDSSILRFHRAIKEVSAFVDGQIVKTKGMKSELFVFDLIPEADPHIGVEVRREEEFAPVKNGNESPTDTPDTARKLSTELFAGWLTRAGVDVTLSPGMQIVISPRFAATEQQFMKRWDGRFSSITESVVIE